mgnify:CR=1 FL=1
MEKKEKVSVWKFNDDEWKIHITSESLKDKQALFIMRMAAFKKKLLGI